MGFTTIDIINNPRLIYRQPKYPFKHYYHPYLVQFLLDSDSNLISHRLRIAMVMFSTDRLSFSPNVHIKMVEDAIQEELDFQDELTFYASLGCFSPSELVTDKWNTIEGLHQMMDTLNKLFRRM